MTVITYCEHCKKYVQCEVKGHLVNKETKELEFYYLKCECCGSLFRKEV